MNNVALCEKISWFPRSPWEPISALPLRSENPLRRDCGRRLQPGWSAFLRRAKGTKIRLVVLLWIAIAGTGSVFAQTDDPALQQRLQQALAAKGADYTPRTEHLLPDGRPKYTNRLILEDSPYLIQHAHNPVDWYSWGPEAFAKARRKNKPIFLSIGYSTCHWCHVMERESFDNEAIAGILNEHFVSIKVDRERRPDLDEIYMTAVTLIAGRGGWPMSSFLTPDGKTFWGGTYFPPDRFKQILRQISDLWQQQRSQLTEQAEQVAARVAEIHAGGGKAQRVDETVLLRAVRSILQRFDPVHGGFSGAPKFPNENLLLLLLDAEQRSPDKSIQEAVETTLDAMAQGGIHDQVGGGFHRYSTDSIWLVPHFEKMLYNQARLARVYLLAFDLTGNPLYAQVARQTLDDLLRDMTDAGGGFYSATDADSEGEEGLFFLWTPDQIKKVLKPKDAKLAIDLYGITESGNFEGRNILFLPMALDRYAKQKNIPLHEFLNNVDRLREQLRQARESRIHPLRDDKILTAWNGMVITTLALAGEILDEPRYLQAAERAAEFLWTNQRRANGGLWRVSLQGSSSTPATQDDYAYFALGLLQLYDATLDDKWLLRARAITDSMIARFWDKQAGGFFMNSPAEDTPLMTRPKASRDSALPSGNAVATQVLAKLVERTARLDYEDKANRTLAAFSEQIVQTPAAYATMLLGAADLLYGETGAHQYAAKGAVSVKAKAVGGAQPNKIALNFRIRPGWHINGHRPLQKDLVATDLTVGADGTGWELKTVDYPEPQLKKLGFSQTELALYEGDFTVPATLTPGHGARITLQLTLQACNDRSCLPPETLFLPVFMDAGQSQ